MEILERSPPSLAHRQDQHLFQESLQDRSVQTAREPELHIWARAPACLGTVEGLPFPTARFPGWQGVPALGVHPPWSLLFRPNSRKEARPAFFLGGPSFSGPA